MYINTTDGIPSIDIRDKKTGEIQSQQYLVSGGSGSGKTRSVLSPLAFYYYNHGFKIIDLSDVKNTMEGAFCCMEPVDKHHLKKLRKFGVPIMGMPTKILHPFTFKIPNRKLPEIQFFTFPIKSLGRDQLSFISETKTDTSTIKVLMDTINDLKKDQGLPHLIYYSEEKSESQENLKGKQLRSLDTNAFFTKGAQGSTQKTISNAIGLFKPFHSGEEADYFLTPMNCKLNINMEEIINDQRHYTILTSKYIPDPKIREFVIDAFLHELIKCLESGKAKYPIFLKIEEVRTLVPDTTEGYKTFLCEDMKNMLSTWRNKGRGNTTAMSTQVYFGVHRDIRSSITELFLGKTASIDEIRDIKKMGINTSDMNVIKELETGEFVSTTPDKYTQPHKPLQPPHRHAEEGTNFEEEYEKVFPEKMQTYTEEKEYMKNIKEKIDNEVKAMAEKYNQEIINSAKNKEKQQQERQEKKIQEHTEKILKKSRKQEEFDINIARVWSKKYTEGMSYQKIADEYKIKHKEEIRRAITKVNKIDNNIQPPEPTVTDTTQKQDFQQ